MDSLLRTFPMSASGDEMNKILTIMAVVLSVLTAAYVVGIDIDSDGAVPYDAQTISDADIRTYTDADLTTGIVRITSASVMDGAFRGCTSLVEVYMTDSVTVGNGAFEGCSGLCYVEGKKLTAIGDRAFKDTGLGQVKFSSLLTDIGEYAFQGCTARTQAILTGTGVTVLKDGVFKDSSLLIEDLRNITEMSATAFDGCNLIGQIVSVGQTVKLTGVTEIAVDDVPATGFITKLINGQDYYLYVGLSNKNMSLSCTDYRGVIEYKAKTLSFYTMTKGCEVSFNCSDIRIEPRTTTISFPDFLSMDPIIHKSGEGTFTVPAPSVGAALFEKWTIGNDIAAVATITEASFQDLPVRFTLNPAYNSAYVTFDHSQIAGNPGVSALPIGTTFTVNDTYPSLDDVDGFAFLGWNVNGSVKNAGSPISTYSDHTAVSLWGATAYTVTIHDTDGSVRSAVSVAPNSVFDLSDLTVDIPEGKYLSGWSRTSGGQVLVSNPTVSSDCSLFPILGDVPIHTISYRDGETLLGTLTGYEGDAVEIEMANPTSVGKVFQYWNLTGSETRYYCGDTIILDSDKVFTASWKPQEVRLSYYHMIEERIAYDWGTAVAVGTENAVRTGYDLLGWSFTYNGPVDVSDGGTLLMNGDKSLYAVWKEIDRSRIVLHHFNGDTTSNTVVSGDSYIVPNGMAREMAVFQGWSLTADGTVNYVSGDTITVSRDIDLFEVWKVNDPEHVSPEIPEEEPGEPQAGNDDISDSPEPQQNTETAETDVADAVPEPPVEENTNSVKEEPSENPPVQQETPQNQDAPHQEPPGYGPASPPQQDPPVTDAPAEEPMQGTEEKEPVKEESDTEVPKDTVRPPEPIPSYVDGENYEPVIQKYTLKLRDGSATVLSKSVRYGYSFDLGSVILQERDGYRLIGWSTDGYSEDPEYGTRSSVIVTKNTTLYTIWEKLVRISFHDADDSESDLVKKGETVHLHTLYHGDKEFLGWSRSVDGPVVGSSITVYSDTDLYAVWRAIQEEPVTVVDDPEPTQDKEEEDDTDVVHHLPSETEIPGTEGNTSSGSSVTLMGAATAVVAAIISVILVIQLRRG